MSLTLCGNNINDRIATLNKFADFCMTEFGNKPDIDTCLMMAKLILRSHGDMVVLREFIKENRGKIIEERSDDRE